MGWLSTAAMIRIPRRKSKTRMFSLGECWLLSGFTVGTITAGRFRVVTNGEIGIEPPDVRTRIGVSPKSRSIARVSQRPGSESKSVRNAA